MKFSVTGVGVGTGIWGERAQGGANFLGFLADSRGFSRGLGLKLRVFSGSASGEAFRMSKFPGLVELKLVCQGG